PHPKEASRLLKCELKDILNDLEGSAKEISKKYNCITVLKTHNTIVTDGEIIYTNQTGCSALAKAGSGDILCGMIAGLAAQGLDVYSASKLGVYLHGLAGDLAAKDLTEYAVLASDLVRYIPFAIKNYTN
ncbi:NAD(P)H-hydrate dehydratase, partial [bacterium]|nr:NAD(P)H-hydrate dehydratase [bacterium]